MFNHVPSAAVGSKVASERKHRRKDMPACWRATPGNSPRRLYAGTVALQRDVHASGFETQRECM